MNPNLDDLPPAEREFGPVANVWWSQKANDEHWLRQMRPSDLPSLQSGDSGPMPGGRGDHSGDQENRGLMSGSVSSPGHGFTALENRVTADAARVSGEMGSLGIVSLSTSILLQMILQRVRVRGFRILMMHNLVLEFMVWELVQCNNSCTTAVTLELVPRGFRRELMSGLGLLRHLQHDFNRAVL